MPTVGIEADKVFDVGYSSHWSHETEMAQPGYYAVTLDDTSVRAELTVGLRVGYHRWQWPMSTPTGEAMVIIDVARAMGKGYCLESQVEILPGERRVRGSMWAQGEWGPIFPVHFDAVFDRDFLDHGTWQDGTFLTGDATADGTEVGAWVALDLVGDATAWAQVGIAYTDLAGAQGNRLDEAVDSFDDAWARAASAWDEQLSVIEVEGGTAREQRIFYSALYHALLHPTLVSDHDERALGFDYLVHQGDRPFYTEAATLLDQSRSSATLWHDGVGFFRGRLADGSWDEPESGEWSDTRWYDYYEQGNAWQYLWLSPHPDLAADLMGGQVAFVARLDEFFALSDEYWEHNTLGYWVPLPYYWHGNEPDLHAPYLYAAIGRPAGTQRWVHWIMATHYDLGPHGLAGNDDCGTLSAWYIFSALGFYPWPGSTRYYVGTPAFDRAVVHLPGGDLTITASGRDLGHYVQDVTLGGAPLNVPWFDHADIVDGGTLHFELGAEPSDWGRVE